MKDLVEEWQTPQLMVDGVTRDDIKQGTLGDCWFLSACAAVSQKKDFMKKVRITQYSSRIRGMPRVHLKLVQLSMSHLGGRLYGIGLNLTVNDKAYEYQNICFRHVDYQNCFLRIDCTIRSAALWTRLQRGRTFSILEIW